MTLGWGAAGAAALAVACYLNALQGELLHDDVGDIVRNELVRRFDVAGIFTRPSWGTWIGIGYSGYRPLTTLTFAVNHALHGLDPLGYHLANVALHAAVSAMLVVLLARMGVGQGASVLTGLLFAAHPVHTEAVASVVGRAELLATLLALVAWWRARPERPQIPSAVGGAVVLGLAMLAKESAVFVVGIVLLADLAIRPPTVRRVATYAALVAGALAAVVWRTAVLRGSAAGITKLDNVLAGEPWGARLPTTLEVVTLYLRRLAWPLGLSADYSYRQIDLASWSDPGCLAGLAIALALTAAMVAARRRAPEVYLGLVLLVVPLAGAAALTFLTLGPTMAERFLYLPSAGFCLLVALGLHRLGSHGRMPVLVIGAAILVFYAGATWARNRVWQGADAFFHALVADAPRSARSHREIATVLSDQGRYDEAIAALRTSLDILPTSSAAYNLGNVLARAGRSEEAIAAYLEALAMKEDFFEAMNNLGHVYGERGDEERAEEWFRKALAIAPRYVHAHVNLANSLLRRGRAAEAEGHYRTAAALEPGNAVARLNHGICLETLGRPEEAVGEYQAALELDPQRPAAYVRLAGALRALGRNGEARRVQERAEVRFPDDPRVRALREPGGR